MLQAGLLIADEAISCTTTVSYAASGLADFYVMMPQRPASYAVSELSGDYIMMLQMLVAYAASGLADVYVMMSQRRRGMSLMLQAGFLMIVMMCCKRAC